MALKHSERAQADGALMLLAFSTDRHKPPFIHSAFMKLKLKSHICKTLHHDESQPLPSLELDAIPQPLAQLAEGIILPIDL
jgi:hypothetical protein